MRRGLLKRLADRLEASLAEDEHFLFDPQVEVLEDILEGGLRQRHTFDYVKGPTSTGKTITAAQQIIAFNRGERWDYPAIVAAPTRVIAEQWHEKLLRPDLFDLESHEVGLYHAFRTHRERREALEAPILVTTHASLMSLVRRGKIDPEDYPILILDEVHLARGDVIRPFIQENFIGTSYVQGWTATDTFITGQTIGDYLFFGQEPVHVTTHIDAVMNGQIAPVRNIVWEPEVQSPVRVEGNRAYTQAERRKIANQSGRDIFAIRQHATFKDPETGLYLRDMDSIWYCVGVEHAKNVARRLNKVFGKGYAVAVSGETPKDKLEKIIADYKNPDHPLSAITNALLLIPGFDAENAQAVYMLSPYRSPIPPEQAGGRAGRLDPNNPGKIAYVLTFLDDNMPDQAIYGHLVGGFWLAPEQKRYARFKQHGKHAAEPQIPESWKSMKVTVHATVAEVHDFFDMRTAKRLQRASAGWFPKTLWASELGVSMKGNQTYDTLWDRIEKEYEEREQAGTVDTDPILINGEPILIARLISSNNYGLIHVHEDSREIWERALKLDRGPSSEWNNKREWAKKLEVNPQNEAFLKLWRRVKAEFDARDEAGILADNPVMIADQPAGVEKRRTKGHFQVMHVHDSAEEIWRKELGLPELATPEWHGKKAWAAKLHTFDKNPKFVALWERLEREYRRKKRNGTLESDPIMVGGEAIQFEERRIDVSKRVIFMIHESAEDACKRELGILEKKTDGHLSKGEWKKRLGVSKDNAAFMEMWEAVRTEYHAKKKAGTLETDPVLVGGAPARFEERSSGYRTEEYVYGTRDVERAWRRELREWEENIDEPGWAKKALASRARVAGRAI